MALFKLNVDNLVCVLVHNLEGKKKDSNFFQFVIWLCFCIIFHNSLNEYMVSEENKTSATDPSPVSIVTAHVQLFRNPKYMHHYQRPSITGGCGGPVLCLQSGHSLYYGHFDFVYLSNTLGLLTKRTIQFHHRLNIKPNWLLTYPRSPMMTQSSLCLTFPQTNAISKAADIYIYIFIKSQTQRLKQSL